MHPESLASLQDQDAIEEQKEAKEEELALH